MADRTACMQIGAKSSKLRTASFSPIVSLACYACPNGHEFEVTLSSEATAPATWGMQVVGQTAELIGETEEDEGYRFSVKPQRTHWDAVERRSIRTRDRLDRATDRPPPQPPRGSTARSPAKQLNASGLTRGSGPPL